MRFLMTNGLYILLLLLFVAMHVMTFDRRWFAAVLRRRYTAKEGPAMAKEWRFVMFAAVGAVLLALVYIGATAYRGGLGEQCTACRRPLHAHSRTAAFVDGRSGLFCCPACALTARQQHGKPVRITELTAYLTGSRLAPEAAYMVQGSDVNLCARSHELIGEHKRAAGKHFDRCAPSLLAFADRSEAVRFAGEHGGKVLPFERVAQELGR